MGETPLIAGRSPLYIFRQPYLFKRAWRKGPLASLMSAPVEDMSEKDMIDVSAYLASLEPGSLGGIMNKVTIGRTIIAAALILGATLSTIIDNMPGPNSHILASATWPPHALFHNAAMFLLLDGGVLIFTWLLFRKSREPQVGALGATLFVWAYWMPFLYITTLFPQASLVPTSPVGVPYNIDNFAIWDPAIRQVTPVVFGIPVHVNGLVGVGWSCMALIGYLLYRRGLKEGAPDSRLIP